MSKAWDGASRVTIVEPMHPAAIKALVDLMPRCRDCRWWMQEDRFHWPLPTGGACSRAESENDEPVSTGSLAVSSDGESIRAILMTSPDFGCVQLEAKP